MFGFSRLKRQSNSAKMAKERLQILLAHERIGTKSPDYLPILQREIMEVIRRHVKIDSKCVDIKLDNGSDVSSLEINIELPSDAQPNTPS